jgi:hypothetical protein
VLYLLIIYAAFWLKTLNSFDKQGFAYTEVTKLTISPSILLYGQLPDIAILQSGWLSIRRILTRFLLEEKTRWRLKKLSEFSERENSKLFAFLWRYMQE